MHRRGFLGRLATGAGSVLMTGHLGSIVYGSPLRVNRLEASPGKRGRVSGSARNLVFVLLEGGASHVDTFDLKLNPETPDFLGATDLGGFLWPAGIMPKMATLADKFALVRSLVAAEAVHERAVYHLTTAYQHDASRVAEIPHFSSAISYQIAGERRAGDSLPTAVQFGPALADNGFFPIEHRALALTDDARIENLVHPFASGDARFQALNRLLDTVPRGDRRGERVLVQRQAEELMADSELQALLGVMDDEEMEYEDGALFKRQAEAVVRILDADKGTRVVQMSSSGWDHHDNIYAQGNLPTLAASLDKGLSQLIEGLDAKPAKVGSGTLLDETLIVVAGEFGRTIDGLNESLGRDHYPYAMSALFAGGGVAGGRVIGATDDRGSYIVDPGWSQQRFMSVPDLVTTMYSALGIDWTQRFSDTPSGRVFELVPTDRIGPVYPIDPLFS